MSKLAPFFGIALVSFMVFGTGCDSDSSIDDYRFVNNSTHQVSLTIHNSTTHKDDHYTLAPNGDEVKVPEFMYDPLSFSYSPTDTVSEQRDGDTIEFKNRM